MPLQEFQIVIYLAGSSETAAGPGLAYANRYFIPVCGNNDRGWGIRWFSRGKFSMGHSDSPSSAFLVCLFFFPSFFPHSASAVIETGCTALYFSSIAVYFPRWFFRLHATVNLTADSLRRSIDLENWSARKADSRGFNFLNYFIHRINFCVCIIIDKYLKIRQYESIKITNNETFLLFFSEECGSRGYLRRPMGWVQTVENCYTKRNLGLNRH